MCQSVKVDLLLCLGLFQQVVECNESSAATDAGTAKGFAEVSSRCFCDFTPSLKCTFDVCQNVNHHKSRRVNAIISVTVHFNFYFLTVSEPPGTDNTMY